MKLENLRCEHRDHPLEIDVAAPLFNWVCDGGVPNRTELRVVVSADSKFQTNLYWDSGWVRQNRTALRCAETAWPSNARIWWKVMARIDGNSETACEAVSWFETGLLRREDWHGSWIRAAKDCEAPVLIRKFSLKSLPKRARLFVSGLGFFELYVNGSPIGEEVLQPVWTSFSRQPLTNLLYPYDYQGVHRVPYRAFMLENVLREGENLLEIHLGNGWYHQVERLVEGDLWYGDSPVLLAELRIDDAFIVSDGEWQWRRSGITRNNLFYGEDTDLRPQRFLLHPVECAQGPTGALRGQSCPSDAAMESYPLKIALPSASGGQILDFGQNISGWIEWIAQARIGDRLTLRYSEEVLQTGSVWEPDFSSTGGNCQIQCDHITFSGAKYDAVRPHFCWHGFRYAEATLTRDGKTIPLAQDGDALIAENFYARPVARFVTAHHAMTGSFHCANDLLNWYHRAAVMSLRANEHCGVPLDCPHRERLGYTGDGQIVLPVALLNLDSCAFLTKWMRDIFDAQNRKTGHIPHTAPFYNGGGGPGGWGGAVVFVPMALYRHTGDAAILDEAWPHMCRWMEYLDAHSVDGIVVREEEGGWCLGDWCAPGEVRIEPELVNTAMTIRMLQEMIEAAKALGYSPETLQEALRKRRSAFIRAFWHSESKGFGAECQGANAFALWCGAVPEGQEDNVFHRLLRDIEENGFHFDTGIFATPILLDVLTCRGRSDIAFALMTAEGYPSFAYMRDNGATTLYENWELGRESHNHAMFGAADAWLYTCVAGISQAKGFTGWENIVFSPGAIASLNSAEASLETPQGRCAIQWERRPDGLFVRTTLPALCRGEIRFPDGQILPARAGTTELIGAPES